MKMTISSVYSKIFLSTSIYIWIVVVFLSLFQALTSVTVWIASIVGLLLGFLLWRKNRLLISFRWSKTTSILAFLCTLTFIQGCVSAPNTTDSMIYHLPRVISWIQEQSIFPSHLITSHDYMPQFSESFVMFLMLLTGNDRLSFLPQWLAGISVIATTAMIAGELGLRPTMRRASVLFVACTPILLLQSVSTQTDLMMTAFFTLSVYFALRKEVFLLAISSALGVVTKQTFFLFSIVPLLIIAPSLRIFLREQLRKIVLATILFFILVFPFFVSNYRLFGTLLGSHTTLDGRTLVLTNERMNLGLFVSNVVRNIFLEIPIPFFGSFIESRVSNDPSTTWYGSTFHVQRAFIPQEDIASNPIQIVLIIAAIIFSFKQKKYSSSKQILGYGILAFLIFCVVMKWQPYHPRLHMALIVVMVPAALAMLSPGEVILKRLVFLSVLMGVVTIVANTSHPFFSYDLIFEKIQGFAPTGAQAPQSIFLQPREDQYFSARPYWRVPYRQLATTLRDAKVDTVSLSLFDEYSYPLLVLLKKQAISVSDLPVDQKIYSESSDRIPNRDQTCYFTATDYGHICSQ